MNRLEDYGWLRHRREGRTFYYAAAAEERTAKKDIIKDVRDRVFGGSRAELIRCLLEVGEVTDEELLALKRMIDATEEKDR